MHELAGTGSRIVRRNGMAIVLLAFIGMSLWLIAGALLLAMRRRGQEIKRVGTFYAKVRATSETTTGVGTEWSSGTAWWVSNVLVVARGFARSNYILLPVWRALPEAIHPAPTDEVGRMGDSPQIVPFLLDPCGAVEVAVGRDNIARALGPFIGQVVATPEQGVEQTQVGR
jgi:hypothetical protein